MPNKIGLFSVAFILGCCSLCLAQSSEPDDSVPSAEPMPAKPMDPAAIQPVSGPELSEGEPHGIDWSSLLKESFVFLSLEHGFRYLTEDGTRHSHLSLLNGYARSLDLHGLADGDPFIVNWVGHPMQGAVAGFLFTANDRKYRMVEFGRNRWYWKSRLRATAYAWAYSEQFEIGPISEASIGHTQAFFPQQGFVDHIATPTVGLGWMVVEDALDKYVCRRVDDRVHNNFVRLLVRGGLNPSRSLANILSFDVPWHRINRIDPWEPPRHELLTTTPKPVHGEGEVHPDLAPFEFFLNTRAVQAVGSNVRGSCVGGGAEAAFRTDPHWQWVVDVGGCKMTPFGDNYSGDSLTYMVGPRWTPNPTRQFSPFAQVLIGGRTLTHEKMYPEKKAALEAQYAQQGKQLSYPDHSLYTTDTEDTGLAVAASAGVDVKLNPAFAFRVVDLGYMHSWHSRLDGINYSNNVQLTAGLIVRFGTW